VAAVVKTGLLVLSGSGGMGILSDAARHPNAAGSVVVGGDLTRHDKESLISDLERGGKPFGVIDVGSLGFVEGLSKATQTAMDIIQDVSTHRRELARFSKLLPVLFHAPDDLTTGVLLGLSKRLRQENGRCLWIEKGAENRKIMNPEFKTHLAGNLGNGEMPGADPGIYRVKGPLGDEGIFKTVLGSGAQIMVFPSGHWKSVPNALIPGLSFAPKNDTGADPISDLDLGQKGDKALKVEDKSLLLFSEILATSSGKLTRNELLSDVLIA
jgi:altronate dehydratase